MIRRVRRWLQTPGAVTELWASSATLIGVTLGTTTTMGAAVYIFANVFWVALIMEKRLWGLVPLVVATTLVSAVNFVRAL